MSGQWHLSDQPVLQNVWTQATVRRCWNYIFNNKKLTGLHWLSNFHMIYSKISKVPFPFHISWQNDGKFTKRCKKRVQGFYSMKNATCLINYFKDTRQFFWIGRQHTLKWQFKKWKAGTLLFHTSPVAFTWVNAWYPFSISNTIASPCDLQEQLD